jgi:hypothetical protein
MDILVDTGAEANLIRQGFVSDHLMHSAENPLKFETVNGQVLSGGTRCTKVRMKLLGEENNGTPPECFEYEVEFYEANIKVDAILSFPWLAQAKLGVFPHHRALVLETPELTFLFGVRDFRKRRHSKHFKKFAPRGGHGPFAQIRFPTTFEWV